MLVFQWVSDGFWSMGLLRRGSSEAILGARQAIPRASGAILGAILGVWKAMLGGYVVHLGPWKAHVADLGGHLVAKSAAKSQHERPKTDICSTCWFSHGFLMVFGRWACLAEAAMRPFSGQGRPSQGSQEPSWGHFWCLEGHVGRL